MASDQGAGAQTQIFISYSRRDHAWLERLQVHLKPLERFGIERWDDTRLQTGRWRDQIERAIDSAKVAILLVSADFLASDFIEKEELPPLLDKAKRKGTVILPVILTSCLFTETKSLSQFMTVNPPSEPLEKLNDHERNEVWVRLARTVLSRLNEVALEAEAAPIQSRIVSQPPPRAQAPSAPEKPEAEAAKTHAVGASPTVLSKPTTGGRFALLVINDKYDVPAFSKLVARSVEPPSLESVLTSPDIGGFNVTTLRNEPCGRVTQEIKAFFASRDPNDLLLLYYSGVALKDCEWGLHFTTTDTDPDEPTTAVPAYILQGAMRKSQSRLQVVLLDCRYVGSHQPGETTDSLDRPGLTAGFQGEGRYVLSAGDTLSLAWEKGTSLKVPEAETSGRPGTLIDELVHGLKSSKADLDGNRRICVEEIFQYLEEAIGAKSPEFRPRRWAFDQSRSGAAIIAKAELPGEDRIPTAIQKRYSVVQDIRLPILDLIAPTYILDKHFYFLDWNPAFDEILAEPLKLVRGLHHAKTLIQALVNCEEVVKHAKEVFGEERQPLTDTEILVYDSDRDGPKKYGVIHFQKVACQISDERGDIKGWSVSLNILRAGDCEKLWADIMARIEQTVSWSRYATVYDTLLLEFPEYLELVKQVTSLVGSSRRCLDLGAGTGNGALRLLADNEKREVWAIDINDTMLRNFRAKLEASGLDYSDRLTVLKDNMIRLDALPPKSFDAAVMINVLYAVADRAEECLSNVNRVLKMGGVLALSTPHRLTDVNRLFDRIQEALDEKGLFAAYQEHFEAARARHDAMEELIHHHTIDDIVALLNQAGFDVAQLIPNQYVGAVAVIKAVKVKEPAVRIASEVAPLPAEVRSALDGRPAAEEIKTMAPAAPAEHLYDVFLSYATHDEAIANAVLDHLESRGIQCWIAPRNVQAGMTWPSAIVHAIDHSRIMLLLLTRNANKSNNAWREVARATEKDVPVLPLRLEAMPPSDDLAFYLSNVHWLDAFPPPLENHLPRLAETITALLSRLVGAAAEARTT